MSLSKLTSRLNATKFVYFSKIKSISYLATKGVAFNSSIRYGNARENIAATSNAVSKQARRCLSTVSASSELAGLKWSYTHGTSNVPFLGATIGQLLQRRAEEIPDKEALVFCHSGIRRTFAQLLEEADGLCAGLLSLGVKKGDRVAVWGPNSWQWVITQYATARAGMILVNINPAYMAEELKYALKKVGCKVIISAPDHQGNDYYDTLLQLIPELPTNNLGAINSQMLPDMQYIIMMEKGDHPGTLLFSDVMEAGGKEQLDHIHNVQDDLQFDDPINIQFTSGTTGFPKGATLSHHNIVNNSYFIGQVLDYDKRETRVCNPVPLYHCFGMVIGSLQNVTHGSCLVYPSPGFNADVTLQAVQDERCTSMYGVPTMFIDMQSSANFHKYDLTSLYTGVMAGSPCPVEVMRKAINEMHMTQVTVAYGSTETSPVTFQSRLDDSVEMRVASVGQVHTHGEAKIIDESGKVLAIGIPGEVCTRGYMTMLDYWNDPERTSKVITKDRWYHTGDVGIMDEEGFVRIVGRIKDLIIRGGENIYPVELENLLYKHPKVQDVQIIAVPDKRLGEEICATVKLKEGELATEDEIKDYVRERVARFKVPRYVIFASDYPMTVTGKIQKYKMREEARRILGLESESS